jgi:hypothetical protein
VVTAVVTAVVKPPGLLASSATGASSQVANTRKHAGRAGYEPHQTPRVSVPPEFMDATIYIVPHRSAISTIGDGDQGVLSWPRQALEFYRQVATKRALP